MQTVQEALRAHRSIRAFTPEAIPDDVVQEVLHEAVIGTSSSGNLNSYSMVLTRDPQRKQRLYELHLQQDFILQAPLVITFCADWNRTRQWLKLRGARDNFNNFLGYHVGAYDAMLLSQSVSLGFEARGYGICYLGTTLYVLPELSEFLSLPETCLPVTTIVVGVPAENPGKRDRLPLSALVHDESYHQPTTTELEDTYREREVRGWERYMANPELKTMCEEGGITSLAEFYTSKYKYDPDFHHPLSLSMLEVLKQKGFLPANLIIQR